MTSVSPLGQRLCPGCFSALHARRPRAVQVHAIPVQSGVQDVLVGGAVFVAISVAFVNGFKADARPCPSCGATGGVRCFACNGSGRMEAGGAPRQGADRKWAGSAFQKQPSHPNACRACDGAGMLFCARCSGTGYIDR
ncbi:BSD2 [Auxenochlorella protothecoides x Auxenochlorella symbiontica]